MNYYATHYRSGEEIKPGDRILWSGEPGTVLFVLGLPGVPVEWISLEDLHGASGGFMLETDIAGFVFQTECDEDLDFIGRKQ